MTTTEAALPYVEALMDLCAAARERGHTMLPARWGEGTLLAECARCWARVAVYEDWRDGRWRLIEHGGIGLLTCVPSEQAKEFRALRYEEAT